jgi:hypothetical protein
MFTVLALVKEAVIWKARQEHLSAWLIVGLAAYIGFMAMPIRRKQ